MTCGVDRLTCGIDRDGLLVLGRRTEIRGVEMRGAEIRGVAMLLGADVAGRLGAGLAAARLEALWAPELRRDVCPCKGTVRANATPTTSATAVALERIFFV